MKEKTVHINILITKLINFSLVSKFKVFQFFVCFADFLGKIIAHSFFVMKEKHYLTFFSYNSILESFLNPFDIL